MLNKHGKEFEDTLAKSWVSSNFKLVRLNITDTGEERPADELVIFEDYTLFNELKSTTSNKFKIRNIRPHQLKSLYNLSDNFRNIISFVFIEFKKKNIVGVVEIKDLIQYCKENNKKYLRTNDFVDIGTLLYKKGNIYELTKSFLWWIDSKKGDDNGND